MKGLLKQINLSSLYRVTGVTISFFNLSVYAKACCVVTVANAKKIMEGICKLKGLRIPFLFSKQLPQNEVVKDYASIYERLTIEQSKSVNNGLRKNSSQWFEGSDLEKLYLQNFHTALLMFWVIVIAIAVLLFFRFN